MQCKRLWCIVKHNFCTSRVILSWAGVLSLLDSRSLVFWSMSYKLKNNQTKEKTVTLLHFSAWIRSQRRKLSRKPALMEPCRAHTLSASTSRTSASAGSSACTRSSQSLKDWLGCLLCSCHEPAKPEPQSCSGTARPLCYFGGQHVRYLVEEDVIAVFQERPDDRE